MRDRLRNAIVLAALVPVPLGLAGSPAHAAKGMEVALQDDGTFVTSRGIARDRGLELADELHVSWLRVNLPWATVVKPRKKKRPKDPHFDFTSYDGLYNAAAAHGIKLELTLMGPAPRWATGNHKRGNYKPRVKYFREFVKATVSHFKGLIERYDIWQEPNYYSWLAPNKRAARTYRRLYLAAYKTIKEIDPEAKVFIGETAPYRIFGRAMAPLKFLRDLLKLGPLKADGYAHHPYDFKHKPNYRYPGRDNVTMGTLYRLTRALKSYADSGRLETPDGKPLDLYLTEYGYKARGKFKVREKRRAKYLTRGFQIALNNPHVRQVVQYLLARPIGRSKFFDTSIVSKHGKRSRTFKALAKWARKNAAAKRIADPAQPEPNYPPAY